MKDWQRTTIILCAFGLFKEFRPSEPFFTEYLISYKNLSQDYLVHYAFPISTYTYLGTLAVVFLVTDFLRYKPIIIVEGLAYVATWIILPFVNGHTGIILVEFLYGIACSTEIAYYTYIYAKVDNIHYKMVTSCTNSAICAGRFLGGVSAQLFVSFNVLNYHELNYVSLGSVGTALVFSLLLPSVNKSIYFHKDEETNTLELEQEVSINLSEKVRRSRTYFFKDLKVAYSNYHTLKWCLWWAVATSGNLLVLNFSQSLWHIIANSSDIDNVDSQTYNAAVEATHTLLSAILAFGVGYLSTDWTKFAESFLCVVCLVQGGLLILMSQTNNLYICYASYILYRVIYQVAFTIANAEVSLRISEDSFGLIFGFNTFVALGMQTILTLVVVDDVGLALDERKQFFVYGFYHGILGVGFLLIFILLLCKFITLPGDILYEDRKHVIKNYGTITDEIDYSITS